MKPKVVNGILAGLIVALLAVAGKVLPEKWEARQRQETRADARHEEKRNAQIRRIAEIRSAMGNLPPGGELELLSADLRQAEADLADMSRR